MENEKFLIAEKDGRFIPLKEKKIDGRTFHTAIQEALGQPQAFSLTQNEKPDFSKGFPDKATAEKVARERWGQGIKFSPMETNKQKVQLVVLEKNGKLIPRVEITKNDISKTGSIYMKDNKPVIVMDKAGKSNMDFNRGFADITTVRAALKKNFGKDIKLSVKSLTPEKTIILQKDGKFHPVEITVNRNGSQTNSVLGKMAGRVVESGQTTEIGKISVNHSRGFADLRSAKAAAHEKWGSDKILTVINQNQGKKPQALGKAGQALQQQRKRQSRGQIQSR